MLYFAESASVAMLEMANYLPSPRLVPGAAVPGVLENIVLANPHRLAPVGIRLIEAAEDIKGWRAFAK